MIRFCYVHRAMTSHVARTEPPFGADCVPCLRADRMHFVFAGTVAGGALVAIVVVLLALAGAL